ncbi:heparan-alpha-glucosaminide N-acetyltransferase domain-containing protein [Nesterenkonia sp. F]|uniref:heparan-alpha-glucosaminide N-acetyltransferase domain-containing protein n=1 Tax=Nesterenkonia sp. F TaxID=795955 RepID=UPI000255C92D|nr:heparan-alpha-glucosaminide N-acetyltransferase domain-containing protein [Nesterenkonia sp. F]
MDPESTAASASRRGSARTRPTGSGRPRLRGVDAARGLALVGMMSVHIIDTVDSGGQDPTWAGWLFTGRPSALFALLAGVGLVLLAGGPRRPTTAGAQWVRSVVAVRAGLILLIGLACGSLDAGVAVILVHYGVLFLLALPFVRMGARGLGVIAVGWVVLGPVVYRGVYLGLSGELVDFATSWRLWHSPGLADLAQPELLAMDLAVTGYYPLLIWPAYFFTGMAIARLDLSRRTVAAALTGVGAALAAVTYLIGRLTLATTSIAADVAGPSGAGAARAELLTGTLLPIIEDPRWFLLATPHSGATVDLLHTIGCALLVLGLCLLAAPALRWPLAPLIGAGAMPLTLYVGHLVVLQDWRAEDGLLTGASPEAMYLGLVIAVLAAGLVKELLSRRGPLESAIRAAGVAAAGKRPVERG